MLDDSSSRMRTEAATNHTREIALDDMSHDLSTGVSEPAKATMHRLDDAHALFNAGRWCGAMYMASYAVECLLKTKLMQMYGCRTFHELEDALQRRGILDEYATVLTYHLELLLRLTQRFAQLRQHRLLWPQFVLVNHWLPAWRYTADMANRQDTADFLAAVIQSIWSELTQKLDTDEWNKISLSIGARPEEIRAI